MTNKSKTKRLKKAEMTALNEFIYGHRYLFETPLTINKMPFTEKELNSWLRGVPPRDMRLSTTMELFEEVNEFLDVLAGLNGNTIEIAKEYAQKCQNKKH